ncbi:glycine oxidase ThiO [Paenibacillus apiarius]|uniref:glycine oxidase n=1 Tax=Paenibacillus apiarius TaxID=46240 RepID=A0ABT4DY03_9BACL|nr:glycine oxidase ThiO [Paenibacillus apiarius]MBN3527454.1 glycine oxidase ThiO [Paenibacillus apiarius]MCY9515936.1 glycine oxidase ThiO [Paenibacillus apiarius]MCY9520846.1 glycine oxidase ThiO [Paenibacillus apiarius]MCY9553551.1 glycine oxidase ThiO [Paenibacillus apiarius]MCY9557926.1 glycine oxidase ThiO [Paenibacillus apiarius]
MSNTTHSPQTADMLIVGGGVIGCAIAYELAKRGLQVTLLERGRLGLGTTCAAAGMLAPVAERFKHEGLGSFARLSLDYFSIWAEELWEQSRVDIELRKRGLFIPVTPAENMHYILNELRQTHSYTNEAANYASGIQWYASPQLMKHEPNMSSELQGAFFLKDEGHVSPTKLTYALARSAEDYGARILESQTVTHILHKNGRVIGVETLGQSWHADSVIICSGLESGMLTRDLGVELNFYPVQGELAVVRTHALQMESIIYGDGTYIVPKSEGNIYIGATSQARRYDRTVKVGAIQRLISQATCLVPALAEAEWIQAWAGLRPATIDGLPFIGPVEGYDGLWLAAGHYRNGILLSAATGVGLAHWITDGAQQMPWPVMAHFAPQRARTRALELFS